MRAAPTGVTRHIAAEGIRRTLDTLPKLRAIGHCVDTRLLELAQFGIQMNSLALGLPETD